MSRELSSAAWLLPGTIGECASSDEEMSALFRTCSPRVLAHLRQRFTDEAAQEATQEAFLRLQRARQRGTRVDNPVAWLRRVAEHVAIDQIRRRRGEVRLTGEALAAVEANGSPSDVPDHRCWERQRLDLLKQAISQLSDRERICLRMRAQGHTFHAIGAEVGMDFRRAAELMHRVLQRLHRCVSHPETSA